MKELFKIVKESEIIEQTRICILQANERNEQMNKLELVMQAIKTTEPEKTLSIFVEAGILEMEAVNAQRRSENGRRQKKERD